MNKLLGDIANLNLRTNDKNKVPMLCKEIKQYYDNIEDGRHSYSEVSTFLYRSDDENLEYLVENLKVIKTYCNKNTQYEKYQVNIKKLIDHIQLELQRINYLEGRQKENIAKIINENQKQTNSLKDTLDKITTKFEKQENEISSWYGNVISILGIFAAIVIAFFGGLSILGNALQNMHSVSKYRLSFIVIIIAFFMFNIIFMLLYIIAKLMNRDISSSCNKKVCSECSKIPSWKCVKEKYPLCFWYNCICMSMILALFLMFFVDYYDIVSYLMSLFYKRVLRSTIPLGCLGIIAVTIILLISIYYIYILVRHSKFGNENENMTIGQ